MAGDNTKLYSILAYIGPLFLVGLLADGEGIRLAKGIERPLHAGT